MVLRRVGIVGIAAIVAMLLGAGNVSSAVAETRSEPDVPALTWEPCGPDYPDAECATARVPLD